MNCWGIRIYFTKLRFSLNGGFIVYVELLSGHEKIITKSWNIKSGFYCICRHSTADDLSHFTIFKRFYLHL